MIAIVAAMSEELSPLVERLGARRTHAPPGQRPFELFVGQLGGRSVALAVTGDGERNARLGAAALGATLSEHRRDALQELVVVGISGAASDDLRPGALVVADEVCYETGRGWRADRASIEAAARRAGARAARVVSATKIVDSPAAKRSLAAGLGATGSPVAVDLESATYVEAAVRAGVPWTVLRVITDAADEALPTWLNRARDDGGSVRRSAVAMGLLGDPRALPVLLRMRARLQNAGVVLATAVERLLRDV